MEENKDLTPETAEAEEVADTQTETAQIAEPSKDKKEKKPKKPKKARPIKNENLFKKGGYSLAITAAVLAAIIIFNILVGVLGERFHLSFDMTSTKDNSISRENVEYIKDIKNDIKIIVCANKEDYTGGYMTYYAQNYGISNDYKEYYEQTVKLIDLYGSYNKNISVEYIDTQSNEFSSVTSKYPNDKISYGDIIVIGDVNGNERHKVVTFTDIYQIEEDSTYAQYGYQMANITGNNVETAVTSAIAYVTANETKKIAFITGHSSTDYTAEYRELLKANNYEISDISDKIVNSISDEFDAIAIVAPTSDFIASEIDAVNAFLDNDGKLNKGLLFFADTKSPYLTNLYDYLAQWGISVGEGVLFETNSQNHMPNDELTLGTYPASDEKITNNMQICVTGNNVPLSKIVDDQLNLEIAELMQTPDSVIAAPVGTAAGWSDTSSYEKGAYDSVIQSAKMDYDDDNKEISNFVYAFSSIDFIHSEYAEYASYSNKDLVLAATEKAMNAEDTGISFVSKVLSDESYANSVTESSANIVRIIFMVLIPVVILAAGIYIFVKRRNA